MRKTLSGPMLLLSSLFLLLLSCAATKLNAVWKDPSFQEQPKKIMIIGMLPAEVSKRFFEDEMARNLRKQGTDAIISYSLLPAQPAPDRAAVEKVMREQGADAVLIARIMDKKTVQSYVPSTPAPRYGGSGYYGSSWGGYYGNTGGGVRTDEFAVIQTNLYDLKTEKLVWTASSDTWLAEDPMSLIKNFIEVIMADLVREKIVAPGKGK
jgi:hypothetical protein